jgi:hypothetical protein
MCFPASRQIAEGPICIFCHSSYEERCRGIERLKFLENRAVFTALFASEEYMMLPTYQSNTALLNRWLKGNKQHRHHRHVVKSEDQVGWLEVLDGQVSALSLDRDVALVVDVTTFPRDRMYLLVDYLLLKFPDNALHIVYFQPESYGTESDAGWLSRDVHSIRPVPRLNGRSRVGAKRLLAMIVGHERARAYGTAVTLEADQMLLFGQGEEQYRAGRAHYANDIVRTICADFQGTAREADVVYLGARNFAAAEEACSKLYNKYHDEYDISLVSYGSKLQSLGFLLAARAQREMRLMHSKVQAYNVVDYSKGIGDCWVVEIGHHARGAWN